MRHKTNEFLRRLQLARPEAKKSFRRPGANTAGESSESLVDPFESLSEFRRETSGSGMKAKNESNVIDFEKNVIALFIN